MSLDDPVIITCAISGALANREQCPAIPYTPQEYAVEARRIVDEGAAMIHIHARRPDGTPSHEVEDFEAIVGAICDELGDEDVIVNLSTGAVGVPVAKRIAYLRALRPDVAALNMGSMNDASVMGVTGAIPPTARNLAAMVDNNPAGRTGASSASRACSGRSSPRRSRSAARSASAGRTTSTCPMGRWRAPTASSSRGRGG